MTPNKKLRDGCTKLSLSLSEEQFVKLETYIEEILAFNKTYNLMKADSADELAVNHILDSLAAHAHIKQLIESKPEDAVVADIGSGGGCPGIPLAIAFPDIQFNDPTLIEHAEQIIKNIKVVMKDKGSKKLDITNGDEEPTVNGRQKYISEDEFDKLYRKLLVILQKQSVYRYKLDKDEFIKTAATEIERTLSRKNDFIKFEITSADVDFNDSRKMEMTDAQRQIEDSSSHTVTYSKRQNNMNVQCAVCNSFEL